MSSQSSPTSWATSLAGSETCLPDEASSDILQELAVISASGRSARSLDVHRFRLPCRSVSTTGRTEQHARRESVARRWQVPQNAGRDIRSAPAMLFTIAAAHQDLRRSNAWLLDQLCHPPGRHPHGAVNSGRQDCLAGVRGRASAAWSGRHRRFGDRRLPRGPGVGSIQDLPGALEREQVQRGGSRRRPSGRSMPSAITPSAFGPSAPWTARSSRRICMPGGNGQQFGDQGTDVYDPWPTCPC